VRFFRKEPLHRRLAREALWLRCFEHMPVDEIGRVMRLENASGARGLLQRARRKLRAALAQRVSETHS